MKVAMTERERSQKLSELQRMLTPRESPRYSPVNMVEELQPVMTEVEEIEEMMREREWLSRYRL